MLQVMIMKKTLGERIREARLERRLTQEELARTVQTTKQNIYKYETGIVTNIPLDRVQLLADALMVKPEWLMGWSDEKTEHSHAVSNRIRNQINEVLASVDSADLDEARASQNIELLEKIVESGSPITVDDAVEIADMLGVSIAGLFEEGKPAIDGELSDQEREFIEKFKSLNQENRQALLVMETALLKNQAAKPGSQGSEPGK